MQEAVQNRQGPSDEESSSDDEQIDAPAWASQRDLDEAIAAFDAGFSRMKPSDAGRTTSSRASRKLLMKWTPSRACS